MEQNKEYVEAIARLRKCHMSARKMRLVVDTIRGKKASRALDALKFTKKEAAGLLEKLLASAIANWRVLTGEEPDEYDLVVKRIWVDQGSQLKRFRPAPHGRAHRIRKHSCHIHLIVANTKPLEVTETVEEAEVLEETE